MSTFRFAALLLLLVTACTDSAPLPGPPCDDRHRPEYCKNACADATCPGEAQSVCEQECRACGPDVAYCPIPDEATASR